MKTAMQELLSEMSNPNWDRLSFDAKYEMFDKLLDLEKEQIIEFANCFYDDCITEGGSLKQSAEDYYNQTYNQNK